MRSRHMAGLRLRARGCGAGKIPSTANSWRSTAQRIDAALGQGYASEFSFPNLHHDLRARGELERFVTDLFTIELDAALRNHAQRFGRARGKSRFLEQVRDRDTFSTRRHGHLCNI